MDPTSRENLAMWTFQAESHTRFHCREREGGREGGRGRERETGRESEKSSPHKQHILVTFLYQVVLAK